MFRYERMKTGRYRQFSQIGAEALRRRKEPAQDVELIDLVMQLLRALGLEGVRLKLNSLGDAACRAARTSRSWSPSSRAHRSELCADCQERLEKNPLRVLDCKNPSVPGGRSPARPTSSSSSASRARAHFEAVQRQLDVARHPLRVNPRIVRGLDYYTRTAFEFIAEDPVLGTASTVGGGGRYDRLVKELGGPDVPAVGFGAGAGPARAAPAGKRARIQPAQPDLFVAVGGRGGRGRGAGAGQPAAARGAPVDFDTRGGSLKSQMKRADRSGATWLAPSSPAEIWSSPRSPRSCRPGRRG